MKRRALLLVLLAGCSVAEAKHLVCDKVFNERHRMWVTSGNCHYEPGPAPETGGARTERHVGDIERIQKYGDGSVRIDRYGMPGHLEEWKEVSPGEWKRIQ